MSGLHYNYSSNLLTGSILWLTTVCEQATTVVTTVVTSRASTIDYNCIYYNFSKSFVSLLANSLLQYEGSPMQISFESPGKVR